MSERHPLDEISEREAALFLAEQATQFGDCAINLMMTCMTTESVVRWLEDQAALLREYE